MLCKVSRASVTLSSVGSSVNANKGLRMLSKIVNTTWSNFVGLTSAFTKIEKNNLILIMTPEKQDKTLELSKHLHKAKNIIAQSTVGGILLHFTVFAFNFSTMWQFFVTLSARAVSFIFVHTENLSSASGCGECAW